MSALILDAGALIAIDRGDRQVLAQRAGELLGRARLQDAIDASVALLAGPGDRVLTSDPGDLRRLCDAVGNRAVVVDC